MKVRAIRYQQLMKMMKARQTQIQIQTKRSRKVNLRLLFKNNSYLVQAGINQLNLRPNYNQIRNLVLSLNTKQNQTRLQIKICSTLISKVSIFEVTKKQRVKVKQSSFSTIFVKLSKQITSLCACPAKGHLNLHQGRAANQDCLLRGTSLRTSICLIDPLLPKNYSQRRRKRKRSTVIENLG